MDYIGSDSQRALIGGLAGTAIGTAFVAGSFPAWPWWVVATAGNCIVLSAGLVGAGVALAIGDWWDRR